MFFCNKFNRFNRLSKCSYYKNQAMQFSTDEITNPKPPNLDLLYLIIGITSIYYILRK
jgi:hypothetical protein